MILPRSHASARGADAWIDERIDLTVRDADRERSCAQARRSIVALLAAIGVAAPRADARRVLLPDVDDDGNAPLF